MTPNFKYFQCNSPFMVHKPKKGKEHFISMNLPQDMLKEIRILKARHNCKTNREFLIFVIRTITFHDNRAEREKDGDGERKGETP